MTLCDSQTLTRWMDQLRGHQAEYMGYRLAGMFELIPHTINPSFLSHMQSRWNSETRSFHIRDRQICPTVEEFRGILRLPKTDILTVCPLDSASSIAGLLQFEFGFTVSTAKSIVRDGKLDLQKWSDIVLASTPVRGVNSLATITILLAHYFLAPPDQKPSAQVFRVAHIIRNKAHDLSGLILAETLIGLNASSLRYRAPSRGSPVALYVWLLDKLSYLPPCRSDALLGVEEQQYRLEQSRDNATVPEERPIRETMPWYGIKKMMYEMDEMPMITLFGLESSVSYYTLHLHGQFGRTSMPERKKNPVPYIGKITKRLSEFYDKRLKAAQELEILERRMGMDDYWSDLIPRGPSAKVRSTLGVSTKRKAAGASTSTQPRKKKSR